MNACASVAMLVASLLLAGAAHAQPIELDGIELSRDVPCLGKDVNISGHANKISLTGNCGAVEVYGTDHEVSLETASALEVSGINNTVTATSVGRLEVDTSQNRVRTAILGHGQTAIVEVSGAEHELELVFDGPAQLSLDGIDNRLKWGGDEPALSSSGIGHKIDRQ
ncbi:DUF3060 domain-containing protein [Pseudomonas stutzeri]|uniref:DUF3060 domain-containing protein n=1 Tax=Stutzerimonas stutzeri TaxID=316 RepID=A0A2N8RX29_STUST|nr:DUF3060 domain-containing protein [Stutzerimonas stutzeri]MCQ4298005.1 DUF3060 domain-containing protein [Stutzerimonas stutzeri]PNF78927.1 hypothetical protein CXK92_20245 [Stutzerimonas stutzeri]